MPSEFLRIRTRVAIKEHLADCGHKISPGEPYVYSVGRTKQTTLACRSIETVKMCLKCFGTPSQWWKGFGITNTCKPEFMIDLWNNRITIGDTVYVFIGNKIHPTCTHTQAMILDGDAVVGVTIYQKKKGQKKPEPIIGPVSLFKVVPE